MLIFRYLLKEVFVALTALTIILLLVFMSNQLIQYLNRAANGQIPGMLIMQVMMLELPTLLSLLLPLGFYVAVLITYGRMYAESEMIVMQACGYGPAALLKHTYYIAAMVAALVLVIMLWISPIIAYDRARLLQTTGVQTLIQTLAPGRFHAFSQDRQVFYVESMNRDHTRAQHIFLAKLLPKEDAEDWDVVWAKQAYTQTDPKTAEDYLLLTQGHRYHGVPGQADYQIVAFKSYQQRLPHPIEMVKRDIRAIKTAQLWPLDNPDLQKAAELQWRFSVPLMVLTLTLVAVPLSRVNPRAGKYARLLPAIVIFILYANFLFIARDWLVHGKIPLWLGLWWVHVLVLLLGLGLCWRNHVKLS